MIKERIGKALKKSKENRWSIRLKSIFPEKDNFDGIVLHYTSELIFIHEIRDFLFDGIIALNRNKIKGIRDNDYEKCENEIIRDNKSIKELKKIKWINNISTFSELIAEIKKREIWPAVEMIDKKSSGFYLGPITDNSKQGFSLYCYDAKGEWEKEYKLKCQGIGKIEFDSKYTNTFNGYMKKNKPFLNLEK